MSVETATLTVDEPGTWDRIGDYLELTKPAHCAVGSLHGRLGGIIARGTAADPWLRGMLCWGRHSSRAGNHSQSGARGEHRCLDAPDRKPTSTERPRAVWEGILLGYAGGVAGTIYLLWMVNKWRPRFRWPVFSCTSSFTRRSNKSPALTPWSAPFQRLPPLVGWAAVTGDLSINALWLFLRLFFWQFPHFFAIAWLHREDYARAGLHMLPTTPLGKRMTGFQMVSFCLVLIPITIAPVMTGSGAGFRHGLSRPGSAVPWLFDCVSHGSVSVKSPARPVQLIVLSAHGTRIVDGRSVRGGM